MGKLILLADGLNTVAGFKLLKKALKKENLQNRTIYLFYEPYDFVAQRLKESCIKLGFQEENIFLSAEPGADQKILSADYVYVTAGNTFEIMEILKERKLIPKIQTAVRKKGASYIGASAGAMIAGIDIALAKDFDRNYVQLQDFEALGLLDGTVIPHYTATELKNYIKNSEPSSFDKYSKIYSVDNGEILVLK